MIYLIEAANQLGLSDLTEQALENKNVHGIIVDIDPFWLFLHRLENLKGYTGIPYPDYYDYLYYLSRESQLFPNLRGALFYAMTTAPLNLNNNPSGWDLAHKKSNLLVKILLRPGTKPVELNYDGPLNIIQEYRPVPLLSSINAQNKRRPLEGGLSIGHAKDPCGTLGGILTASKTAEQFALTCGHVITSPSCQADQPSQNDDIFASPVGQCVFSKIPIPAGGILCNPYNNTTLNEFDIALIKIDPAVQANKSIINIGTVNGRTPNSMLQPNLLTEFNGRTSGYKSLVLGGIGLVQQFVNSNGQLCCFKNLIEVKDPSMTSLLLNRPVKGGDSGAWLITQGETGNEWCGMIVGEDRQTGYAMMAESLLTYLSDNLYDLQCC